MAEPIDVDVVLINGAPLVTNPEDPPTWTRDHGIEYGPDTVMARGDRVIRVRFGEEWLEFSLADERDERWLMERCNARLRLWWRGIDRVAYVDCVRARPPWMSMSSPLRFRARLFPIPEA